MAFLLHVLLTAVAAGQVAAPLQVFHRARALAPGEAVLVDVRSSETFSEVYADWMGQRIAFDKVSANAWQGIVPIDLGASPGLHTMQVHARTAAGLERSRAYPLRVARQTFPVRTLSVDPKFAEPPAEALGRIRREQQAVEAIFAKSTPGRQWTGGFAPPVPGAATSSFGRRSIVNGAPRSPHSGTDFQAETGTPVTAPNRGTVALAADHYFSGRVVILDHGNGVYSYLAHLSEVHVPEGAVVERGQTIGSSGATGRVTGPHLHWTLRVGRARIDPLSLIFVSRPSASSGRPRGD